MNKLLVRKYDKLNIQERNAKYTYVSKTNKCRKKECIKNERKLMESEMCQKKSDLSLKERNTFINLTQAGAYELY